MTTRRDIAVAFLAGFAALILAGPIAIRPAAAARATSDLDGLWRSRGYGWIWSIEDKRIAIYHAASRTCVAGGFDSRSVDEPGLDLRLEEGGLVLRVIDDDPAYAYVFDRIAALPGSCGPTPDPGPLSVLDAVDDIFTTHYSFFESRGVDWPVLIESARAQVDSDTSDLDLYIVLAELLSHVPDGHVALEANVDGRDLEFESGLGTTMTAAAAQAARENVSFASMLRRWQRNDWSEDVAVTLLQRAGRVTADDTIRYGRIDDDIGYVNIRSMEGFAANGDDDTAALDSAMDRVIASFRGAAAVIVDITLNDGGRDLLARRIAGRFAAERTLAYSKFAGDDPTAQPQGVYVEPSEGRPRFTGPVYLLTSDFTLSAAEVFTLAMRALPNVTQVGQATRGCFSDELFKPLPNGWWLSVSNEVYLDTDGVAWEGRGVEPEVEFGVFSTADVTTGHVEALGRVVGLIRQRMRQH